MLHARSWLWLAVLLAAGCQRSAEVNELGESTAPPAAASDSTPAARTPSAPNAETAPLGAEILVANPTDVAPVQAAAAIEPARPAPGTAAMLVVRLKLAAGWHIYASDGGVGANQPTRIKATLPAGCTALGAWEAPAGSVMATANGVAEIYETDVIFKQSVEFAAAMPAGEASIACEVSYQACDRSRCLRPERLTINVPVQLSEEN